MSTASPPKPNRMADQVRECVDDFLKIHHDWQASEERDDPDDTYWGGVDSLLAAFDEITIPGEMRHLATAVREFSQEVDVFVNREDQETHYPHLAFWAAIERIEQVRNAPDMIDHYRANPLDSVLALDKQGVPHDQIARIWGLFHANGEPNRAAVRQELDIPGSVIKPGHDPRIKEEIEKRRRFEERQSQHADDYPATENSPAKPCHETPEELFAQGVEAPQASLMLKRPREEVQEMWNQFTDAARKKSQARDARILAESHRSTVPAAPAGDISDESAGYGSGRADGPNSEPQGDDAHVPQRTAEDTTAAIHELLAEGWSARDIAKELKIPWQRVAAEVRKTNRSQAATAGDDK